MHSASIARVLVDSPLPQLDRLFDYRVPDELRDAAQPGVRVKVPLRSAGRVADGYLVELVDAGDYTGVLSDLDSVVSPIPVLTPEIARLARKAADRAAGSATDIVRLAIPKRQVRVEKAYLAATSPPPTEDAADDAPEADAFLPEPVVAAAVEHYETGVVEHAVLTGGRLALDAVPLVHEVEPDVWVGTWAVTMASAAALSLEAGKSAILAVPDYRDQEQLMSALRAVLPADRIVRLDAKQSNPDRYRAFLRCLGDVPLAIVGNRSVMYAPAARLGLIAVWDDGDPLHSEPLSPYVHTRDAALLRQEQQGASLIFLGHSRSTEVERLVELGWLTSVSPVPTYRPKVIPTAQQQSTDRLAAQARIPSSAWREARAALEHGPVLVQVARPGYAPRLACADCRQSARCMICEGPLGQKTQHSTPACTWCGALAANWHCTNCDGTKLRFVGAGASRTAEDLGRAFPGVRIIIADGERPILTVGSEPALVIATRGAEPIAAGGYHAVLLLDGERMVARESLRVGEDCLRWWSNAIALARRGAPSVLVGVGGALASTLATWRHADYARSELGDRRRLRFPPAVRVATVTGPLDAVTTALGALPVAGEDLLGPVDTDPGSVRTIVRFDYSHGAEVAATLRAEVIRNATTRRKSAGVKGPRPPLPPSLRVRFDDVEPFGE
ncbi:primosomal protein N' [Glaciihabitans sp. dw_435]|uniref:primosomal protein N' family DNA-binding protein n=1 Tax=Glaciihabitans sp. dw_435 TaxID=2720081 RepID=UPI001BD2BAE0|nr:primosomal protein N' [Glaciihabitans sp. dw_435]